MTLFLKTTYSNSITISAIIMLTETRKYTNLFYVIMMDGDDLSSYNLPIPERCTDDRLLTEYFREIDCDKEYLAVQDDYFLIDDQSEA